MTGKHFSFDKYRKYFLIDKTGFKLKENIFYFDVATKHRKILGSKIMLTFLKYAICVIRREKLNMHINTVFNLNSLYSNYIYLLTLKL